MTEAQYGKVEYLDPKKIEIHKDTPNIRSRINKGECKDLMNSISERGVQNPITVFQSNGNTYLVSGERRLSSVLWLSEEYPKEARFKQIPVLVKKYGKEFIRDVLFDNMIENIQREDLNGYDIAMRLKMLIDMGMEKTAICQQIGKSITWVNETLKFLESDKELQDAVKKGDLSLDEGKKIAKLPDEKQATVAKGLVQAKEIAQKTGDKSAKKKIKKGIDKATRKRSGVAPSKKEISVQKNTVFEILEAMKKAGDKDSKPFLVLSGAYLTLQWSMGEQRDMQLDKYLRKYKLDIGVDGRKVVPKPKKTTKKKAASSKKKK